MDQGSGVTMNCGVGRRHGSDRVLLWLWCRLTAAAPELTLAWELSYAMGVALQSRTKQNTLIINDACGDCLFSSPKSYEQVLRS